MSTATADASLETESDGAPPEDNGGTRRGGGDAARRVLALLVVLMLVATVVLGLVWNHQRQQRQALDRARVQAVTAAEQFMVDLDAISNATVDKDIARVEALTVDPFKASFKSSEADLKTAEKAAQSTSSGRVTASGTVSYDQDEATVLVAVDHSVRTAADQTGAVSHDRWQVSVEKHGGRWLVAGLDSVA